MLNLVPKLLPSNNFFMLHLRIFLSIYFLFFWGWGWGKAGVRIADEGK